jgi:hypothetical protein
MGAESIQKFLVMMTFDTNFWRKTMQKTQKARANLSFMFQCKECEATPQGKHEDHFELCTCGAIAVSGGPYPKINTIYPDSYRYYYGENEWEE